MIIQVPICVVIKFSTKLFEVTIIKHIYEYLNEAI